MNKLRYISIFLSSVALIQFVRVIFLFGFIGHRHLFTDYFLTVCSLVVCTIVASLLYFLFIRKSGVKLKNFLYEQCIMLCLVSFVIIALQLIGVDSLFASLFQTHLLGKLFPGMIVDLCVGLTFLIISGILGNIITLSITKRSPWSNKNKYISRLTLYLFSVRNIESAYFCVPL